MPSFDSSKIVRLTGSIDEEASENFLAGLREMSLTGVDGGITVVIHSDGGDTEDAFRILDAFKLLKDSGFMIRTILTGKAYSMVSYIFCMGDYRTIYPNGRLMFHMSRYPELQDNDVTCARLMELYKDLKFYDDRFVQIMKSVGIPRRLISRAKAEDVYLSAEEAVKLGVAHAIEHEIL